MNTWKKKLRFTLSFALGGVLALLLWLVVTPVQGIPILEYHMVGHDELPDEKPYIVPTEDFSAKLDYLQQAGYTTITLREFAAAKRGDFVLPEKPIVLTFDDGYEDNATEMLPVLEQHGMKATMFMVTNNIGLEHYLSWDQLYDMQARGVEIGSHTANHLPLTTLTADQQSDELRLSKLMLEWNGIQPVVSFSYPNGAYDMDLAQKVQDTGYLLAVTGDAGLNTFETDPVLLQRINIPHPRFGITEFRLRLLKGEIFAKLGIRQHTL